MDHYAPPETANTPRSTASMSAGTASNRSCVMVSSIGIKVSGYALYDVPSALLLRYYTDMDRTPEDALAHLLEDARARVPVGARYSHFKHPEREYVIRDHALHEASESPLVIYEACYGSGLVFARPLSNFLEDVEHAGGRTPRFSRR